jgi:oligopeptide/dipeptide ABC transporter ATP-binding protein
MSIQAGSESRRLLQLVDVCVEFESQPGERKMVLDHVSFEVERGEHVGLVGESGAGKSTIARAVMGLLNTRDTKLAGEICFMGQSMNGMNDRELNRVRGTRLTLIPQDASVALNPVLTVGTQIVETLRVHNVGNGKSLEEIAIENLRRVGLADPRRVMSAHCSSLSGGMKQRVGIAIALMTDPDLIIADEPTSAVDVTIQAQIIAEFRELTARVGASSLFITHDLRVVAELCSRLVVLYAGQVAEVGPVEELLVNPKHPYTAALVACSPSVAERRNPLPTIPGNPADAMQSAGCRFYGRCPRRLAACASVSPPLNAAGDSRSLACWNPLA